MTRLESFLNFPVTEQVLSMADAYWGPQDASQSKTGLELPLFTPWSMSAFYIYLVLFTGHPSAKPLLQVAQLWLKCML